MKITRPKRILVALIIGLALSCLSLIYTREMTAIIYNNRSDCEVGADCTTWYSKEGKLNTNGFPFSAITQDSDGELIVYTWNFLGNWLLYSGLVYIVLLVLVRKAKTI